MQNGKRLKDHPGKIALVVFIGIMSWVSQPKTNRVGDNFPRPDPSKGPAWGYDFKKGDYRYKSEWPKDKPLPEAKHSNKGEDPPYVPSVDMDIDPQEVRDYYGY